jgi:enoyl-CoA hydratase/carnithine racemase
MSYETVTFEVERGVGVLTLNRPAVLNAINQPMVDEIMDVQARAARDTAIQVLVLAGSGRSFCAGYDLKEADKGERRRGVLETRDLLTRDFEMTMGFWECPKPTLAAVHGHCLAGGCELALACDLTIASRDARFGEPELRFGAGIVCMILPWLTGPKQAKELIFTGNDKISAEHALQMGLVNRVVDEGKALEETMRMARQIAVMDEHALAITKAAINRGYEIMGMRDALRTALDLDVQITTLDTPDRLKFREISRRDGLKAALAWRESRFDAG